jgi:hypothetical protein
MIKFIIAALWISAVTAGSVYYSFTSTSSRPEAEAPQAYFGGLDYVKTDVISVPVFSKGAVYGYFLTRLVYTVEPARMKALSVPAGPLLSDAVYSYLYANPDIDFSRKERPDLDAFRAALKDSINTRLGTQLIHEVMVEQVDFLTKEDIRDNTIRRRKAEEQASNEPAPAKARGEASHH